MRVPNSIVADITYDSLFDGPEASNRQLTFTAADVEVSVTVRHQRAREDRHVDVECAIDGSVSLLTITDPVATKAATLTQGRVRITCPSGLMSLLITPDSHHHTAMQTAWVTI